MTKTEYRQYIGSEEWQQRRSIFLEEAGTCNRCFLPRHLAIIAYDQDLNVHHRSYANLGQEEPGDLEALCRRCHEIESFGISQLHEVQKKPCPDCAWGGWVFDPWSLKCESCLLELRFLEGLAYAQGACARGRARKAGK